MKNLIHDWLDSRKEQISVFEGDDEITLKRQGDTILLQAQLTSSSLDHTALHTWMRLGGASLNHFHGALARKPETGALWLTQSLRGAQGEADVLKGLETLLNQRDTWRAIAARFARTGQNLKPTSLRSLS